MRLSASNLSLLVVLAAFPAAAQTTQFLSVSEAVKVVMDGRPWNGLTADGRKARLTFKADGTGTFEGPITMSISWEPKNEDLCLNLRLAGTKCLRFRPVPGGYEAYNGGKLDLTLTR